MEKYTMFMDQKNQYSENEYTTQSNLQIQCNPYQANNGIFQRTRTNNFTICMKIQKTSNSQSNLEKEEWNWRIDAFELWCWRRLLRVPWTARRSNQSILKEISWVFIGRTDVKAETPILWPPDAKS